jgi:hypothetical protein
VFKPHRSDNRPCVCQHPHPMPRSAMPFAHNLLTLRTLVHAIDACIDDRWPFTHQIINNLIILQEVGQKITAPLLHNLLSHADPVEIQESVGWSTSTARPSHLGLSSDKGARVVKSCQQSRTGWQKRKAECRPIHKTTCGLHEHSYHKCRLCASWYR